MTVAMATSSLIQRLALPYLPNCCQSCWMAAARAVAGAPCQSTNARSIWRRRPSATSTTSASPPCK
eukprot:6173574-Pleurochrysis_carterae.AAC.1